MQKSKGNTIMITPLSKYELIIFFVIGMFISFIVGLK